MSFLYRYATGYKGMTFANSANIGTHPDKGSVSNYAIKPFCWAIAYHIYQLSSPRDYLYPKQIVTRGETALLVARLSWFIDKLSTNERFKFPNAPSAFYSESYGKIYINSFSRNRLYKLINAYYGAGTAGAKTAWDTMLSTMQEKWGGSCHGMTMCVLLDKQGKIDFNRSFSGTPIMATVPTPKDNLNVEGAINFYQIAYSLASGHRKDYSTTDKTISTGANNFVAHVRNYGLTAFNFFYTTTDNGKTQTSGHSVIASSITFNAANNCYYVSVIDPNVPGNRVTRALKISSNSVTFDGKNLTSFNYYTQSTLDFWDNYDIDGSYNNPNKIPPDERGVTVEVTQGNMENETLYQSDTALIMVPFVPFEVENDMGEKLICDGESISGNMHILETQISPNGSDAAAGLSLRVATSERFTFRTSNDSDTYFFVTTPQYYGGASGENLDYITVSSDGTVYVGGNNVTYDAIVALDEARTGYVSASGHSDNEVAIQASNGHVNIIGVEESDLSYYCNGGNMSIPVKIAGSSAGFRVNISVSEKFVAFHIIDRATNDRTYSANWAQ